MRESEANTTKYTHAKDELLVVPAGPRDPVHPAITEELISELVESFYAKAQKDERLGPLFNDRIDGDWPMHLDKMKKFWSSVLLKSGKYKGKPVPVHMAISEIESDDFRLWLEMFRTTAEDVLGVEPAAPAILAAERIAQSLWMAKFATPFDKVPDWMFAKSA